MLIRSAGLAGSAPTWGLDEVDVMGDIRVDDEAVDAAGVGAPLSLYESMAPFLLD